MQEEMTRLELLTVLYSLQDLLKLDKTEEAKTVIEKIIKEAEKESND